MYPGFSAGNLHNAASGITKTVSSKHLKDFYEHITADFNSKKKLHCHANCVWKNNSISLPH